MSDPDSGMCGRSHPRFDVVLDDPDATPDDLRDMALDIRAAVDHAERLIGALLLLARNERGLITHEPSTWPP